MTATALTKPVALAGTRQQHYKMSIAFLTGEASESEPVDTGLTNNCYAHPPAPTPVPNSAVSTFHMPSYQPELRPRMPITFPSLCLDHSTYSNYSSTTSHLSCIGSLSSLNSFSSVASSHSWTGSSASSSSSIHDSPVKRRDSLWNSEFNSAASYHSNNSFNRINAAHAHGNSHRYYPSHTEPLARISRPIRPSYSEEQKFFIMYNRVVKQQSWHEIENKFAFFFKIRTKDGLTSVYYRIRKDWGMEEVLKTGPGGSMSDRRKVEDKAAHFPREFLNNLGYFDWSLLA